MQIIPFPQDYLAALRRRAGEDPITGIAPVEEVILEDVELKLVDEDGDGDPEIVLRPAKNSDKRIGRIPSEALYWYMVAKHGPRWFDQEIEVITENLLRWPLQLDVGGWSKVMALRALMLGPDRGSAFYADWKAFCFLSCSLMGRPVRWHELVLPSPVEAGVALLIAQELRPMPLHEQVLGCIAALCVEAGLWVLPESLVAAQDHALNAMRYWGHGLTADDVTSVRSRVGDLLNTGASLDDDDSLPDVDEEGIDDRELWLRAQTLRAFEVASRIRELHEHGQGAKDKVFDSLGDVIRSKT